MFSLIACVMYLRRKQSQMAVGPWIVCMSFIALAMTCWYFYDGGSWYIATVAHTIRLVANVLAAAALLFYNRRSNQIRKAIHRHGWNILALVLLQVLYGSGCIRPASYCFCALAGIAGVVRSEGIRRQKYLTIGWIALWVMIGLAAWFGGFRTAAYWGLAGTYIAAAINLWRRMPKGIGRIAACTSLGIFALTFTTHSWVLIHPFLRPLSDSIWTLQNYFVSLGFVIAMLEVEIKTNHWLIRHDTLTGLPNHRVLEANLLQMVETGSAAVLLIDLDDFRKVNASMGREAGDEALQRIATLLSQIIEADELLVRFGGDRFVIASPRNLSHLTYVLQALIAEPMLIDDIHTQFTASVGTADFPADTKNLTRHQAIAELLHVSERRMNQNKRGDKTAFLARWPSLSRIH